MVLSWMGFLLTLIVLYKLTSFAVRRLVHSFSEIEASMTGRQFVHRVADPEVNQVMTDAFAAFSPGQWYLIAGALAAGVTILAVPFFHLLYALWVRLIMTFTDPPRYAAQVLGTSLQQISGYMPRVMINFVALIFVGMYYAKKRRHYLSHGITRRILWWQASAVEVFGTTLGWTLYFVAAMLPRRIDDGWTNFAGLLSLAGGWMWAFSGILISMYLRSAQNAVLWIVFRYRWSEAIPSIVRMMTMRRLSMPQSVVKEIDLDESEGRALIRAQIDPIDADRLHDSLLAIPGLRDPQVTALGAPPDMPDRIPVDLPPRMRPLPPRVFRRPEGPPKGYGAEYDLLPRAKGPDDGPEAKKTPKTPKNTTNDAT
ncbi:MAG: hypothetical protein ACOYEP_05350 [Limnochordia bacterium]